MRLNRFDFLRLSGLTVVYIGHPELFACTSVFPGYFGRVLKFGKNSTVFIIFGHYQKLMSIRNKELNVNIGFLEDKYLFLFTQTESKEWAYSNVVCKCD